MTDESSGSGLGVPASLPLKIPPGQEKYNQIRVLHEAIQLRDILQTSSGVGQVGINENANGGDERLQPVLHHLDLILTEELLNHSSHDDKRSQTAEPQ